MCNKHFNLDPIPTRSTNWGIKSTFCHIAGSDPPVDESDLAIVCSGNANHYKRAFHTVQNLRVGTGSDPEIFLNRFHTAKISTLL